MPTPQRLPVVNSDDGVWGDIIRQYIMKEHYDDGSDNAANGGHQKITVRAGTTTAGTAPLKFTSGSVLTSPEAGAVEFNADSLYFTITTGNARRKIAMYDDSVGATGDLYYRNSSGYFTRLPVGNNGQRLAVSGGSPTWADNNGSWQTATKTSSYTISSSDTVIFANATSGAVTITLPAASGMAGYRFYIKRIDGSANGCSVARSGSDTIDGQTSLTIDLQYASLTVVSDGNAWYIL